MNDRFLSSRFFKPSGISKAGARTPPSPNDQQEVKQEIEQHEAVELKAKNHEQPKQEEANLDKRISDLIYAAHEITTAVSKIEQSRQKLAEAHTEIVNVERRYKDLLDEHIEYFDRLSKESLKYEVTQASIDAFNNVFNVGCKQVVKDFSDHRYLLNQMMERLREEQKSDFNSNKSKLSIECLNLVNAIHREKTNFLLDFKNALLRQGFWCSERAFRWLFGVFVGSITLNVLMIAALIMGMLRF